MINLKKLEQKIEEDLNDIYKNHDESAVELLAHDESLVSIIFSEKLSSEPHKEKLYQIVKKISTFENKGRKKDLFLKKKDPHFAATEKPLKIGKYFVKYGEYTGFMGDFFLHVGRRDKISSEMVRSVQNSIESMRKSIADWEKHEIFWRKKANMDDIDGKAGLLEL